MRAIRVEHHGGPEVLTAADVPEPEPGPDEVRIRVEAAGVNFIDVYQRTGQYATEPPFVPGVEGAGTVDAVGANVTGVAVGDRVGWTMASGGYAEVVTVPAARVVAVPDGVDSATAAAVLLQGMTAHYLATSTVPLSNGHTVLVHAGAGGVGLLLTQIATLRGARVITTVSTDDKAALSRAAGAAEAILYTETDFAAEVARIAPGGVDVVYDSVGKDTFDRGFGCLRPRGTMVLYGQSSGPVDPVDPQRLNSGGSLYLTRPSLAHYTADRDEHEQRAAELFGWLAEGRLDVRIGETHPLEGAATAHRRLEGRQTTGKVLLIP